MAGTLPLTGVAADPFLTPDFPGLTDKTDIRSWDPPFPFDRSRIRSGDANERFWEEFRTTPKAYVTLKAGQKLWGSRFGVLTSVRLAAPGDLDAHAAEFEKTLLNLLQQDPAGLTLQSLRDQAQTASQGGTDFSMLFVCFSFFLILAALLLVALLFRLNLDRRAAEIGLLLATGYRRGVVTWLLLTEGMFLALIAAAVGIAAALGYAMLLVQLLATLWPGGALKAILRPEFQQFSIQSRDRLCVVRGCLHPHHCLVAAWTDTHSATHFAGGSDCSGGGIGSATAALELVGRWRLPCSGSVCADGRHVRPGPRGQGRLLLWWRCLAADRGAGVVARLDAFWQPRHRGRPRVVDHRPPGISQCRTQPAAQHVDCGPTCLGCLPHRGCRIVPASCRTRQWKHHITGWRVQPFR